MDYSKIYKDIIAKARLLSEERGGQENEYFEIHHIVPKSSGGTNDKENLVCLTAREHFMCHWLLYKIDPTDANCFAWWMMSNNDGTPHHKDRKRQSSRKYEYARKAFSKHISKINKGRVHTQEARDNMSKAAKKRSGADSHMFGKRHSKEHKDYLREINLGSKNAFYGKKHSEESRKKISEAKKKLVGEKHPHFGKDLMKEETKQRFSDMYKGKPRKKPHDIVTCPYCGNSGIKPNMIRWHFDKCKMKGNQQYE